MSGDTQTPDDLAAYSDAVRAEIARSGGDIATAVGIVLGAASACWSNLEGAGVFQSERAGALVDLLVGYIREGAGA